MVREQKWLSEDFDGEEQANWDYKIKVHPWTFLGLVTVQLDGTNMQVQHVYGGMGGLGKSKIVVSLDAVPVGGDDMFTISGYGSPKGPPKLTCANLFEVLLRPVKSMHWACLHPMPVLPPP